MEEVLVINPPNLHLNPRLKRWSHQEHPNREESLNKRRCLEVKNPVVTPSAVQRLPFRPPSRVLPPHQQRRLQLLQRSLETPCAIRQPIYVVNDFSSLDYARPLPGQRCKALIELIPCLGRELSIQDKRITKKNHPDDSSCLESTATRSLTILQPSAISAELQSKDLSSIAGQELVDVQSSAGTSTEEVILNVLEEWPAALLEEVHKVLECLPTLEETARLAEKSSDTAIPESTAETTKKTKPKKSHKKKKPSSDPLNEPLTGADSNLDLPKANGENPADEPVKKKKAPRKERVNSKKSKTKKGKKGDTKKSLAEWVEHYRKYTLLQCLTMRLPEEAPEIQVPITFSKDFPQTHKALRWWYLKYGAQSTLTLSQWPSVLCEMVAKKEDIKFGAEYFPQLSTEELYAAKLSLVQLSDLKLKEDLALSQRLLEQKEEEDRRRLSEENRFLYDPSFLDRLQRYGKSAVERAVESIITPQVIDAVCNKLQENIQKRWKEEDNIPVHANPKFKRVPLIVIDDD